jgi:hypothetical protein
MLRPKRRSPSVLRLFAITLSLLVGTACNDLSHPTGPVASDTTGSIAAMRRKAANGPRFDIDGNGQSVNTNIHVEAGTILTFEVESSSNGWCDQVYLGGVLSGTLFRSVGPSWCGTPEPVTIGPVRTSGTYTIVTEISRFWGRVFGRFDGSARVDDIGDGAYRISIEDSDDADFDDIVIVVRTKQPDVVLACNNAIGKTPRVQVARGDTLTCTVRPLTDEVGPVWASGWKFDGAPRRDGDTLSNVWKGVMVRSGVVEVKAHSGARRNPSAQLQTLTATVEVLDRKWTPHVSWKIVTNGEDDRLILNEVIEFAHDLGAVNFFDVEDRTKNPDDPIDEVRDGPNNGLFYYKDLRFFAYAPIVLNLSAMRRGSPFYLAQEPDRPGSGSGSRLGTNWCDQSYVSGNLQKDVFDHEHQHVAVYHEARVRELKDVTRRLETFTDTAPTAMYQDYKTAYTRSDSIARRETVEIVDDVNGPFTVRFRDGQGPCLLRNEAGGILTNRRR